MKKISVTFFIILILSVSLFCGCKKEFSLYDYVTDERIDIFTGENSNYKVKSYYTAQKENNEKKYSLIFFLQNVTSDTVQHTLTASLNGNAYSDVFKFSSLHNSLCCEFSLIDELTLKSFDISIQKANEKETVSLISIVPENTIPPTTALNKLYEQQKTFIDGYFENEKFIGTLTVRIVVKDDKGYYYIGLTDLNNKTTAMLIDGESGNVLAIRKVF